MGEKYISKIKLVAAVVFPFIPFALSTAPLGNVQYLHLSRVLYSIDWSYFINKGIGLPKEKKKKKTSDLGKHEGKVIKMSRHQL